MNSGTFALVHRILACYMMAPTIPHLAIKYMLTERVIKKYANRRLYDSTDSRHVTLDDIRKMIVSGQKIKVVDDKSGEDLTRAVMLQVIAEQEQFGTPVLSTELLESIIRFYGNPVQEMVTKYMEQSVGLLARQQHAMQSEMAKVLAGPMNPLAEFTRQNMEQWSKLQAAMFSGFAPQTARPAQTREQDQREDGK